MKMIMMIMMIMMKMMIIMKMMMIIKTQKMINQIKKNQLKYLEKQITELKIYIILFQVLKITLKQQKKYQQKLIYLKKLIKNMLGFLDFQYQ